MGNQQSPCLQMLSSSPASLGTNMAQQRVKGQLTVWASRGRRRAAQLSSYNTWPSTRQPARIFQHRFYAREHFCVVP